LVCIHPEGS
jgi:Grx4 family monothiol glutaredoxin